MTVAKAPSPAPPGPRPDADGLKYEISPEVVVLSQDHVAEAEAIRTMRTHILARHIKAGRRGLAVCAPTPEAGATFTAVNLAVGLSRVGISTLLVDGDMRDPSVNKLIRPSAPVLGLSDYLSSQEDTVADYIQHNVMPNLSVLFAGQPTDDAQELLAGEQFRQLTVRALRDYEFTVIDTPPTNICADARRISSVVGYCVLVARAHNTLMSDLSNLAQRLQADGAHIVGTVLHEA